MNRPTLLATLTALVLLGALAWWFLTPSGITLHFNKTPLAQVLPVIEKKTKVQIITDIDPATPVTLMVHQASPAVVWDALAGALDARPSLRVALAPDRATLTAYQQALRSGQRPQDWETHRYPLPGPGGGFAGDPLDPRTIPLALPDSWPATSFKEHLMLLAQASEATWAAPTTWTPPTSFSPTPNSKIPQAAAALARAASGTHTIFLFLSSGRRGGGESWGPPSGGGGGEAGPGIRRGTFAPEVMERRIEARLAALPPDQQAAAREEWERDRAFFEQMRDLTPEQRREKMAEYFNDPAVQERMEERQASRDERRSPERRRERYRDYIERRAQQQQQQQQP